MVADGGGGVRRDGVRSRRRRHVLPNQSNSTELRVMDRTRISHCPWDPSLRRRRHPCRCLPRPGSPWYCRATLKRQTSDDEQL